MARRDHRPPRRPLFSVRSSSIHGKGVFALRRIDQGTRIVEYKGERITHEVADRRHGVEHGAIHSHTMLYAVSSKVVIDATRGGNSARWINHSCSPNCRAQDMDGRIYIQALRVIRPGEELTYDYELYLDGRHTKAARAAYPCFCGSHRCKGTMLGSKR